MNYRHSFHAGNFCDVFKHAALLLLIKALHQKEGALTIIDTHAGRGLYDLTSSEAGRTNEAEGGIMRAWEAGEIYLTDYIHTVAAFNPKDQLRYYPGSPSFLAHTARPQDKIVVNEKHPDEAAALRHVFARDKQVSIHERDGYEVWQALTPPKTPRGVVFIDPPFEQTNEFSQIAKTLIATHKKWSHGVVFIWFPIKDRGTLTRFYDTLAESGIPKILLAEHLVYNTERAGRLNGSGIIVVNAPYQFTQELPLLLNAVQNSIKATDEAGKTVIRWISDEA